MNINAIDSKIVKNYYPFHDGGRYRIEMDWFLYDNGLRYERGKSTIYNLC